MDYSIRCATTPKFDPFNCASPDPGQGVQREVVIRFNLGTQTVFHRTTDCTDKGRAAFIRFVKELMIAADFLVPGTFTPLPKEDEATAAEAIRIASLADAIEQGIGGAL